MFDIYLVYFNTGYRWTDKALKMALDQFNKNSDINKNKIIILLTNDKPDNNHEPCIKSDNNINYISPTLLSLKDELDVSIITVGINIINNIKNEYFSCLGKTDEFYIDVTVDNNFMHNINNMHSSSTMFPLSQSYVAGSSTTTSSISYSSTESTTSDDSYASISSTAIQSPSSSAYDNASTTSASNEYDISSTDISTTANDGSSTTVSSMSYESTESTTFDNSPSSSAYDRLSSTVSILPIPWPSSDRSSTIFPSSPANDGYDGSSTTESSQLSTESTTIPSPSSPAYDRLSSTVSSLPMPWPSNDRSSTVFPSSPAIHVYDISTTSSSDTSIIDVSDLSQSICDVICSALR